MSTQDKFNLAVEIVQNLPKEGAFQPSNDLKLKFYGHYKQATIGKCNTTRPGMLDFVGKSKWDAWNKLGDMGVEEAMVGYVDGLRQMIESVPPEGLNPALNEKIGRFMAMTK